MEYIDNRRFNRATSLMPNTLTTDTNNKAKSILPNYHSALLAVSFNNSEMEETINDRLYDNINSNEMENFTLCYQIFATYLSKFEITN